MKETCPVNGFGGVGRKNLPAFEIPIFKLGTVTFACMVIAADYGRQFNCDLILGSNLFKYAKVTIDRFRSADSNHPPFIIYQFDRKFYDIKTYKSKGVITRSSILSQELEQECPQAASLNIF